MTRAYDRGPIVLTALTAVGSAALALGLLFAWQAWSSRSAEPIDDLLPRLVASRTTAEPAATSAMGDEARTPSVTPTSAVVAVPVPVPVSAGVEPQSVVVHVSGQVQDPGIVEVEIGDRVHHAVEQAGGVSGRADLDRVNLAAPVVDGDRIHIPRVGEHAPDVIGPDRSIANGGVSGMVSLTPVPIMVQLNSATVAELTALPGIGPSLAQSIVTTRTDRGPFRTVDELVEVSGIGPAKLEQVRPFVTVATG